jgi:ABC-type transport system involved in multi-copper enzyme maturation permease subunit
MHSLLTLNLKWIIRDRILQALTAVSLLLILLVPVLSAFSMRQSRELAVTLSLSFISFVLLVFTLVLGSTMLWRDIERRYTYAVLSLPLDRGNYIVAKYLAAVICIFTAAAIIGLCAVPVITFSALQESADFPLQWGRIGLVVLMDCLKYSLLAAVAILISTVSTSFFMPFFTSVALYLTGSASQEVYEVISSGTSLQLPGMVRTAARFVYFCIPNFGSFNFKLQAIYPIPLDAVHVAYQISYFLVYTTICLSLSIWLFSRRELT